MSAARGEACPLARKLKAAASDPPHVAARVIDELELEVVARQIAADRERDFEVRRQLEGQLAADSGKAATGDEVEVKLKSRGVGGVLVGGLCSASELYTIGRDDIPASGVATVIKDLYVGGRGGSCEQK